MKMLLQVFSSIAKYSTGSESEVKPFILFIAGICSKRASCGAGCRSKVALHDCGDNFEIGISNAKESEYSR